MTGRVRAPVKLAAIARELDVSVSTVSKVVNGRADVAAGTRARVREALARHGYPLKDSPTGGARLHSALLDVVIHRLDSAWAATLLTEVERAAAELDLNIVVSTVQHDPAHPAPPRRWLDQVAARGSCGVLGILVDFTATQAEYLRDSGIPRVVIDPAVEQRGPVTTIHLSNFDSQYRLTRHLIELGHRDIAVVAGNLSTLPATERLAGFEAAVAESGLRPRPEWRRLGGFDRPASERAMDALLRLPNPPTAVVFASDKGALGGLTAASLLGVAVPGEVSVTGFDDIADAADCAPALTTARQPVREMVDAALRKITHPHEPEERIVCEAELVIRHSTAPPGR